MLDRPGLWPRAVAGAAVVTFLLFALLTRPPPPTVKPSGNDGVLEIEVDLRHGHPVAKTLFGIFFEEINFAGEGGLYVEKVQDRSFDALARSTGFDPSASNAALFHPLSDSAFMPSELQLIPEDSGDVLTYDQELKKNLTGPPVAWTPLGEKLELALVSDAPLGEGNPVALQIKSAATDKTPVGITNAGFWGIDVQPTSNYHVSLFLRSPDSSVAKVTVALHSGDGATVHGSADFADVGPKWQRFEGAIPLSQQATDADGRLTVSFEGAGVLQLDVVSLLPAENVKRGHMNPWPFRADLVQMLKDLRPRFLRFPGGCYVEGDRMANSFYWKRSVGLAAERPGHWNLWGYWSTDGLGLFEYMQLAEELNTEAIWVINNGVSHEESIPTSEIQSMVQDALDSMQFVTGPPESKWGAVRAAMGHPEPWRLNYLAIGNEDCGKPFYTENYIAFYEALRAEYPHLRLIANCDMGQSAPTELYDWHVYTHPAEMFALRTVFDNISASNPAHVFASEYAVTTGGGRGNLIGAIAEAGFMTGLERNSEAVEMAAYAPLFVHKEFVGWPTNLIVMDNQRAFGIPSFHVQRLFAQYQGTRYVDTTVSAAGELALVAASTTCQTDDCATIAIKVVNMAMEPCTASIRLPGLSDGAVHPSGNLTVLTGRDPLEENSFEEPFKVSPTVSEINTLGNSFQLQLPSLSFSVIAVNLSPKEAGIVR